MKGVVLAGGRGTRVSALTKGANKHLLPVAGRAMIDYPITALLDAGISDITIVTNPEHEGALREHLAPSPLRERGEFHIALQQSPAGIADALCGAQSHTGDEPICVILGDNLLGLSIRPHAEVFAASPRGAMVLLSDTDEPERYAIATFTQGDPGLPIADIVEKPEDPPGSAAVIGVYFYGPGVYDVARSLTPSSRGELEITDVNRAYLRAGSLSHRFIEGWWADAGTPEGLARAESLLTQPERRA